MIKISWFEKRPQIGVAAAPVWVCLPIPLNRKSSNSHPDRIPVIKDFLAGHKGSVCLIVGNSQAQH